MAKTKVPGIPLPPNTFSPQERGFLLALKEIMEVREGIRGDVLDASVTFRDLLGDPAADIIQPAAGRPRIASMGGASYNASIPPAITGFTASGAYSQIILSFDHPAYGNHAHTEIWRSSGIALGTAVLIGTTSSDVYSDSCGESRVYYYWSRAVSTSDVVGPYHSINGVRGETSPDIPYLLTVLTGGISEAQLYKSLADRISLIDDGGTITKTVTQRLNDLYAAAQTEFVNIETFNAYQTADAAFAEQVRAMAFVDPTDGTVSALEGVIITQDSDRNNTAVRFDSLDSRLNNSGGAGVSVEARITNESITRANQDLAIATSVAQLRADAESSFATNTALNTAKADLAGSIASSTNQLAARLNNADGGTGGAVTIEAAYAAQASTNGLLNAQYTVKIDNAGYVAGFGLASTSPSHNETPSSEFYVRADRFAVGSPGAAKAIPFVVQSADGLVDGVTVPAGVYIDSAYIKNASITGAKIGNAAIDTAQIKDAAITNAKIGSISAEKITFDHATGETLKAAYIEGAVIVGTVSIEAPVITGGEVSGSSITGGTITGGSLNIPNAISPKFKVDAAGNVTIKSATSGNYLLIQGDVIKVFQGGVQRVVIGNLASTAS